MYNTWLQAVENNFLKSERRDLLEKVLNRACSMQFRLVRFKIQKGSVFMRKFLSTLLAVMLTVCFAGSVIAITTDYEDGTIVYHGEVVEISSLTQEQLLEYYGYNAAMENMAAMAALDASASAFVIPGTEALYGDQIDRLVKIHRNDFLSDLAVSIMEQGTGGSSYQDPGQYMPYESCVELIEYFYERAKEMGFDNEPYSRIVKVPAPNFTVPPHKRSARLPGQTDAQYWVAGSAVPYYMYVELGAKSLPEVTLQIAHMDPWEDTGGVRGDRGGWKDVDYHTGMDTGGVFITPIHVATPNRFWTLGGSHQANVIRDPVTMRWVMVGRGGDDDRGPAVAMLYSMKAIMDSEVPLRRRIRNVFGVTEDSTTEFRSITTSTLLPFFGNTSFGEIRWYGHQDEWPVLSVTADSGVVPIMFGQASASASPSITLSWTNNPATGIGLRFPNALNYRHEYSGGSSISAANQWGSGSGSWTGTGITFTDGAPTALPALLYNQARESFVYKTYYAGAWSGTSTGQSLNLVTWLVPPVNATAANVTALLNAANAVKSNYRISWGGWEYPDEIDSRPKTQKVPLAGRWDAGIDIIRVDTRTGQTYNTDNVNANAVQVVTTGHVTRFWEKEYFSARHIMADFLSKIVIPTGFTAPWQSEMRKLIAFYPFDNFRERKVWNGNTMVGNHLGKQIWSGTLCSFGNFTPQFRTPIAGDSSYVAANPSATPAHGAEAWTAKTTGANVAYTNRGRNDENVDQINVSINFSYTSIPVHPNVPANAFNGLMDGGLLGPAIRARATELGLNLTAPSGATGNATAIQYCQPDADVLWKAHRAYNDYYKRFGVMDPGYTGTIKEDRPDFIAGGTYATGFRLPTVSTGTQNSATFDGRMIAVGAWGGRGTLHGWNERVEIDGMVDFVKRCARIFTEYAAGVPHTWRVSGGPATPDRTVPTGGIRMPYIGFPEKGKLDYAKSNDVIPHIYIQEESVVKPIVTKLYSNGALPRNETTEILFARKFKMSELTGTTPAMSLTAELTNSAGVRRSGKVYLIGKVHQTGVSEVNSDWNVVAQSTTGQATFAFAPNSIYDMTSASADREVEVSVIALVVTNGSSTVMDFGAEVENEENSAEGGSTSSSGNGCNVGFLVLALAALPFVVRRRN